MFMFETRAAVQTALDDCATCRAALSGDELALAHAHYDANWPLPRLLAPIRERLATAMHQRGAKAVRGVRQPVIAAPHLA